MAFHPFRTFRKERTQKIIMGGLVIVCMLTFVLAYGKGDIFERIVTMIRASKTTTPVTTIYNQTVDYRQLQNVRMQRQLAQRALEVGSGIAYSQINKELETIRAAQANKLPDLKTDTREQQERQIKLSLEQENVRREYGVHQTLAQLFGRSEAQVAEALLDFLVWRHQADQLGIQLDRDGVDQELKRRTSGRVTLADILPELFRNAQGQTGEADVEKALIDEFRVNLAQQAVLGEDLEHAILNSQNFFFMQQNSLAEVPAPVTPYEFWNYYEKQRTAVDVALVPVPVEAPATPAGSLSEQDLREIQALYNRYKNEEPKPGQPHPGFKVPRRIKVAWARAPIGSPYYEKGSAEAVQLLRATVAVGGVLGSSVQTGVPMVADPFFLSQYKELKQEAPGRFDLAGLAQADYALSVYTTRAHPEEVAAAVAEAAGGQALLSPLGAVTAYQAGALVRNEKDRDMQELVAQEARAKRIPYGCTFLLSGTQTAGAAPLTAALMATTLTAYGSVTPETLPATSALVRRMVSERERTMLARTLAEGNLKNFQKDMVAQRSRGANAEAKAEAVTKWLPKALEQYHLELMPKPMEKAHDQYDLAKSPALKPLLDAFRPTPPGMPGTPEEGKDEQFANQLLTLGQGNYDPVTWPPEAAPSPFMPQPKEKGEFLVWRTQDDPAYVPDFKDVEQQVIAAWRFQKARIATEDRADKLRSVLGKTGGDLAQVTQVAEEKVQHRPIVLKAVAREIPEDVAAPSGHQYRPYQFPKDEFPYPGQDWVGDLVDKLKNKGDTVVLTDQPEKTFYVAVLLDRHDAKVGTFRDVYRDAASSFSRDPMLDTLVRERREKYRGEVTKQLRIEAGADPKTGQFVYSKEYKDMQKGRENTEE